MTRSKQILALLVSLVALVALAPAASAANGSDRVRWNSVDPNPRSYSQPDASKWGSLKPNSTQRCSCELNTYRIKVVEFQFAQGTVYKIKAVSPQASRFNG